MVAAQADSCIWLVAVSRQDGGSVAAWAWPAKPHQALVLVAGFGLSQPAVRRGQPELGGGVPHQDPLVLEGGGRKGPPPDGLEGVALGAGHGGLRKLSA